MNLLCRPQLASSPATRLGGLSPGFKPSTCHCLCRCLGASSLQADSSWSRFGGQVLLSRICQFCVYVLDRQKSLGTSSDIQRGGRLESPSAASAQEIPELPIDRGVQQRALRRSVYVFSEYVSILYKFPRDKEFIDRKLYSPSN